MLYLEERQQVCDIARIMFDRKLTNAAGGNISMRINKEHVIMTPTLMSQRKFCKLKPEEIIVMDYDMNKIEGVGGITRESNMHLGVLKEVPLAQAIIHAHPQYAMVYASLGIDIPVYIEACDKLKEIIALPYEKACSADLANRATKYFGERKDEIHNHALVALLSRHGILVADKDLYKAYDYLERVELNSYVALQAKIFDINNKLELCEE